MKSQIALAVLVGCAAAVVSAQSPSSSFPRGSSKQSWQNPGLKNVLAKCKNPPQLFSIPGAGQSANAPPPDPVLPATAAIPGVLAAGQSWKVVWSWEGNNVDGPIAGDNGSVLFANNEASNVMQVDPSTGLAKIVHRDTNTRFVSSIPGPQGLHGTFFGGRDKTTLFGIVFYGGWGTSSARNRIIAIPTIAQGYTGRAK